MNTHLISLGSILLTESDLTHVRAFFHFCVCSLKRAFASTTLSLRWIRRRRRRRRARPFSSNAPDFCHRRLSRRRRRLHYTRDSPAWRSRAFFLSQTDVVVVFFFFLFLFLCSIALVVVDWARARGNSHECMFVWAARRRLRTYERTQDEIKRSSPVSDSSLGGQLLRKRRLFVLRHAGDNWCLSGGGGGGGGGQLVTLATLD